MIEEFSRVRLKKAIPGADIPLGSTGVVVMVHPATPPGYEVEFYDGQGNMLYDSKTEEFVFTVEDEHIELLDLK